MTSPASSCYCNASWLAAGWQSSHRTEPPAARAHERMTMRVGILSYPMLFQRDGGLQIQVRETIAALNRLPQLPARPLDVQLVDANHQRLADFDVLHVFSAR